MSFTSYSLVQVFFDDKCFVLCHHRWGQVFILDSISNYNPKDEKEAQRLEIVCYVRMRIVLSDLKEK